MQGTRRQDFPAVAIFLAGCGRPQRVHLVPQEVATQVQEAEGSLHLHECKRKKHGALQRPKRWFLRRDYQTTKKQRVFGMTTSNGKSLQFLVPKPRTAEQWAEDVKKKVAPFLQRCFPNLTSYQVLLDGEPLLHAPPAKAALRNSNVTVLPNWPKYSAQLNPQEHVWFLRVYTNPLGKDGASCGPPSIQELRPWRTQQSAETECCILGPGSGALDPGSWDHHPGPRSIQETDSWMRGGGRTLSIILAPFIL